jgi:uracil-DNA glycosylase
MSFVRIEDSWRQALHEEFEAPYFEDLIEFVKQEYTEHTCYPSGKNIFAAFDHCPIDEVRVVILGQDPYHGPDQANGLCFSVNEGVAIPPSLRNIYKELAADLGIRTPASGDLSRWAAQGVLLLNATLTVRASEAGSHQKKGWEQFTDAVVKTVDRNCEGVIFVLWGSYAQKKGFHIDLAKHETLVAPHPSPLSAHRGFYGSQPFSQINTILSKRGDRAIDWS